MYVYIFLLLIIYIIIEVEEKNNIINDIKISENTCTYFTYKDIFFGIK